MSKDGFKDILWKPQLRALVRIQETFDDDLDVHVSMFEGGFGGWMNEVGVTESVSAAMPQKESKE